MGASVPDAVRATVDTWLDHRTGDVTSKTATREWAAAEIPEHAVVLQAAVHIRHSTQPVPLGRQLTEQVLVLVRDVVHRMTG